MPPKSEPQFYKDLGKGTLEVVPAGFQDRNHRGNFWKWRGTATETSISQPAPVGILQGLSFGQLTLGCWEESLPRMKGVLIKKGSFLDTKVEPE